MVIRDGSNNKIWRLMIFIFNHSERKREQRFRVQADRAKQKINDIQQNDYTIVTSNNGRRSESTWSSTYKPSFT